MYACICVCIHYGIFCGAFYICSSILYSKFVSKLFFILACTKIIENFLKKKIG